MPTSMLRWTPFSVMVEPSMASGLDERLVVRDDVLAQPVDLVRPVAQVGVEHRHAGGNQVGVGDPRAVEPVVRLGAPCRP